MTSALIIIHGFVQGVGFRKFVEKEANKLGLTGWVQNLPASPKGGTNGKVEINAIGEKENIEKLIALCKKGSTIAEVESMDVSWGEDEPGYEFMIL